MVIKILIIVIINAVARDMTVRYCQSVYLTDNSHDTGITLNFLAQDVCNVGDVDEKDHDM